MASTSGCRNVGCANVMCTATSTAAASVVSVTRWPADDSIMMMMARVMLV